MMMQKKKILIIILILFIMKVCNTISSSISSQCSSQIIPNHKTLSKVTMKQQVMIVMIHGRRRKRKPTIKINSTMIQNSMVSQIDQVDDKRRKVNWHEKDETLKSHRDEDKFGNGESVGTERRDGLEGVMELVNILVDKWPVKNSVSEVGPEVSEDEVQDCSEDVGWPAAEKIGSPIF